MPEAEQTAVLVLCDPERARDLGPFCADLRRSGPFDVEVTTDTGRLLQLHGVGVLYAHRSEGALTAEQADAVARFARDGGTVVAVGATLQAWSAHEPVVDAAGWTPNGRTVRTELDVEHVDGGERFRVVDRFNLLPVAPRDAEPLLLAQWQFSSQVLAYRRPVGGGTFTYVGLGHDPRVYANPGARRILVRAVGGLDARTPPRQIGVGLLGFGALGPAHAAALASVPGLRLAAVCDRDARRRDAARALDPVAAVVAGDRELERLDDVDVIVVATPPATHAAAVLQALDAGRHVVCEKPFALSTAECDRMIERAADRGLMLTVFQNRRWDPDFVALRRVVRSGAIGELFHMEAFVGGYSHPCHLWHSHQAVSGGAVFDWGSHYIDWILQLFDEPVVAVRGQETKRVWHDVTNADHVSVDIRFDGGGAASFVHSDIAAAAKPKWYVLGTDGAVVADWRHATRRRRGPDGELDEEPVPPTDLPARVSVLRPDRDSGGINRETLALPRRDRSGFYRNLAAHLMHGDPLAVQPAEARRVVAVMEAATESAARGGALVERRI